MSGFRVSGLRVFVRVYVGLRVSQGHCVLPSGGMK